MALRKELRRLLKTIEELSPKIDFQLIEETEPLPIQSESATVIDPLAPIFNRENK